MVGLKCFTVHPLIFFLLEMIEENEGDPPLQSKLNIFLFKGEFVYCLFCDTIGIECSLFPDHIKNCIGAKPLCEIIPRKNIDYEKIAEFA